MEQCFVTAPKRKRLDFEGMPPHPTVSGLERLETTVQNVYCSVHISIQHKLTVRALVGTLRQVFRNQFAAARTHLGRVAGIYQNDGSASFCRGADCQADKLRPRNIHDAFSHSTAFAHFLRGKFFKHNHLVLVHQRTALLMGEIATSVSNSFVNTGKNTLLLGVF